MEPPRRLLIVGLCVLQLLGLPYSDANEQLQSLDQQLETADEQLDFLTSRLVKLTSELEKMLTNQEDAEIKANHVLSTMDREEGKTGACQRGYFPCGPGPDGGVQCVRYYLVCDGSADCKNGADEADVCDRMPFTEPFRASGRVLFEHCQLGLDALDAERHLTGVFNTAEINPWFPSRPKISWTIIAPMDTHDGYLKSVFTEFGFYNYATGEINGLFNRMLGTRDDITVRRPATGKLILWGESWTVYGDTPCCVYPMTYIYA